MTFQPVLPSSGIQGWNFLARTLPAQQAAHAASGPVESGLKHLRDALPKIETAADLVGDWMSLKVVLGTYGLQDDLPNRFFVQRVMEQGVSDPDSLANRLADPRYAALAKDFDFSQGRPAALSDDGFLERLERRFTARDFEVAVGRQDTSMRLALGLERDLTALTERVIGGDAQWFAIMGNPPLRKVFATALGLPPETAAIDIDQQLGLFRRKSIALFGISEPAGFVEREMVPELRDRFLLQAKPGQEVAGSSPALTLLTAGASSARVLSALYPAA